MIEKILAVAPQIDVSELRAGISRNDRMEGFAPPRRVLLEFAEVSACVMLREQWCLKRAPRFKGLS